MTEKAIVMDITDDEMILLTQDGRFVSRKVVSPVPMIGTEITIQCVKKKRFFMPYTVLVAAAILLLTFFASRLWFQSPVTTTLGAAVSFVTIDINPSVELGIDINGNVILAKGLNADGEKILQGKEIIGQKSEVAVEIVVDSAIEYGYLAPEKGNNIIINVSGKEDSNRKLVEMTDKLPESAKKVLLKRKLNAQVEAFKTDIVVYQESKELGVSAGKYALFLEAKEAGLNINPKDVVQGGIVQAIKAAGGHPGEIISKARQEKEFTDKVKEWKSLKEERKEFERLVKEEVIKQKKEKNKKEQLGKEDKEQPKKWNDKQQVSPGKMNTNVRESIKNNSKGNNGKINNSKNDNGKSNNGKKNNGENDSEKNNNRNGKNDNGKNNSRKGKAEVEKNSKPEIPENQGEREKEN